MDEPVPAANAAVCIECAGYFCDLVPEQGDKQGAPEPATENVRKIRESCLVCGRWMTREPMFRVLEDGSVCETIQLRLDSTSHLTVSVVPLLVGRYRLEETALLTSDYVYRGDVIEAELLPDRTHKFVRVLEPAPTRHYSWVLSRSWIESPAGDAYTEAVEAAGGSWEQVMGGILIVHIPLKSPFDAEAELRRHL